VGLFGGFIESPSARENVYKDEREAFLKIRDKLIRDSLYTGKYVAVFQGAVAGCDEKKERLAENVYEK